MLENNDQNKVVVPDSGLREDYYTTTGKKVGDFFLGFFGGLVFSFVLGNIFGSLFIFVGSYVANIVVSLITSVALIYLFFKINRRFIAIGIIAMSLIPILILGSCALLFVGFNGIH